MSATPAVPEPSRPVCYLSRRRGWTDPERPKRPTSEVNLLAIALRSRVWTLDTAWASIFNTPVPREIAHAYRRAMSRATMSDAQVDLLRAVADRLRIELRVID
jgi:hypothetical protein